jgi:hypothetical protein
LDLRDLVFILFGAGLTRSPLRAVPVLTLYPNSMKKTFLWLSIFCAGCSIVPEDAFENLPAMTLKNITITSDFEQVGSSQQLIGVVSYEGSSMIIDWTGTLDPFDYPEEVNKFRYDYNSAGLVTKFTTYMDDEIVRTEELSYNDQGRVSQSVFKVATTTVTDTYIYSDNVLERINRHSQVGPNEFEGFFYTNHGGLYSVIVVAVYPYDPDLGDEPEADDEFPCGYTAFANDNYKYGSHFELPNHDDMFQHVNYNITVLNAAGQDVVEKNSVLYETLYLPLNKMVRTITSRLQPDPTSSSDCNGNLIGVSPYRLIPHLNNDYAILAMTNMPEDRYLSGGFYGQTLSEFNTLKIEFEYDYAD